MEIRATHFALAAFLDSPSRLIFIVSMSKRDSIRKPHPVQASSEIATGTAVCKTSIFDNWYLRSGVSLLLIGYMFVVLLGPLSNPVGSEFLTRPLATMVAPIHRSLFLGHGYRFFGPDPGPSHMVVYRVVDNSGDVIEKRFPDRNEIWPRLMYHRWFMLSETLFQEHNFTIDKESFTENDKELTLQVEALRLKGKRSIANRIEFERQQLTQQYQNSRQRIEELVAAIAKNLLQRHNGTQIEMFLQERSIPFPAAVLTGQKISEPQFLSPLRKIGEFRLNEAGQFESMGWSPESETKAGTQPKVGPQIEANPGFDPRNKINAEPMQADDPSENKEGARK